METILVPWFIEIYNEFSDKLRWANNDQWEKAFKKYLDDEVIEKVFEKIK